MTTLSIPTDGWYVLADARVHASTVEGLAGQALVAQRGGQQQLGNQPGRADPGQQQEALRDYLNRGGVLFADACCGSSSFDRSFRDLVQQLYYNSILDQKD